MRGLRIAGLVLILVGLACFIPFWIELMAWDNWNGKASSYVLSDEDKAPAQAKADELKPIVQAWGFSGFGGVIVGGGLLGASFLFGRKPRRASDGRGAEAGLPRSGERTDESS